MSLKVRVVAGAMPEDKHYNQFHPEIRVQAWSGRDWEGNWHTLAHYKLEEREAAIRCARQVEKLPSIPEMFIPREPDRPGCIIYATREQPPPPASEQGPVGFFLRRTPSDEAPSEPPTSDPR